MCWWGWGGISGVAGHPSQFSTKTRAEALALGYSWCQASISSSQPSSSTGCFLQVALPATSPWVSHLVPFRSHNHISSLQRTPSLYSMASTQGCSSDLVRCLGPQRKCPQRDGDCTESKKVTSMKHVFHKSHFSPLGGKRKC